MRVAVYHGGQSAITIDEVATPQPGPEDVLVEVGFCGICGSDVSMTSGAGWDYEPGTHLGHEYCGTVVELGSRVQGLRTGDLVTCVPNGFCGACQACRDGRLLSCRNGKPQMGGMGGYVAVRDASAVRLSGMVGLDEAALVEPLACARHGLDAGNVCGGDHVLVVGAGPLALAVIHNAVLRGARKIGVLSRSARGRDLALQFGASYFLSEEYDGPEAAQRILADLPDVVVECAGAPGLLARSAELVRPAGTVVSMGMCGSAEPLLPILCTFKELKMVFPLGYSLADFEATIREFDQGAVDPASMVKRVIGLDALPAALASMREGGNEGKILIDPRM
ncbi:zinc-dependent alcohol dehydrogenase [Novosphingobium sp. M1R2S20]|uniref:Zinc-binding dehydrogenase n=1 Tax=Novosphingobium rhizovicinum TaxID=3228928 RepID=A0ABV3REB8_9SPHN